MIKFFEFNFYHIAKFNVVFLYSSSQLNQSSGWFLLSKDGIIKLPKR